MNSAGVTPQSLQQKWQFSVEIDGFDAAFFQKADFPKVEFDEVAFAPAGSMFDQKAAGRASFPDITLEKGVPQENVEENVLDWIRQCITVAAATGGVPSDYMRSASLVEYDRTGAEIKRFNLKNAWVKSADMGEGDGSASDNNIESMTLCYQYFTTGAA
jgi:phage tail-like protein